MSIFYNKQHFLHKYVTYLESTEIKGSEHFTQFISNFNISNLESYYNVDHSSIDWDKTQNSHQFFFDYTGNEEIENWLRESDLKQHEYLYTWLNWDDPIIIIKTAEFIQNWKWFYIASVEGMVLITEDGSKFLEFTDDYKHHLNSNFEIKPNSKIT
ncbi:MAG: hypothetical protein DI539_02330 [Flavobacterium psychrophilum]|nr:MAG: hypothetical protein DI539_02330 [Flavobacterium psychrophilum]